MTVDHKKRATSTLSPVPDMLQSPVSNAMTPSHQRTAHALTQLREETKVEIIRHLQYDRNAINAARKAVAKSRNWSDMDEKQRDRAMDKAALARIEQRKAKGIYISNYFPAFKKYIPPAAYGRIWREDSKKDVLISHVLDSLDETSARTQMEEDDDEEKDPRIKKQDDDDSELESIASDTKGQKAAPAKRGKAGKAGVRDDVDSDIGESSAADSNDEDQDVSDAESEISEPESEEDEGEDDDEEDEDDRVTFVAVSRGRPLPSDMPLPAKAYVNRKQHFATGIKCIEQAVVRGQIPRDDEKGQKLDDSVENKDSASKKRACEDGENGGRALRKTKKVKAEANA